MSSSKLSIVLVSMVVFGAPISVSGCKSANASPSSSSSSLAGEEDDPLVVHEWGTFTSFQGADGVSVEGMQHETEALPSFVHSRLSAETSPLSIYGDASRDVPIRRCTGKMETPVIYFHTKSPRHVKVEVSYQGLLTQWYPAASRTTPAFTGLAERHDLAAVVSSSLEWDLDLVPPASRGLPSVPTVPKESDWQKAREVDAAFVRTTGIERSQAAAGAGAAKAGEESEQYIFYRGLMRTVPQPKVMPDALHDDAVTIANASSSETLRAAFVLDMTATEGRFVSLGAIAPGVRSSSTFNNGTPYRSKTTVVAEVTQAMTAALEAEGLFADEARAMVRTWSEPWFSSNGRRVLYLVPRVVTDATLPLRITPAPDRLVRVIVGRIEYLGRDQQAAVARDVIDAGSAPGEHPELRGPALVRLARLGRFAEPATRAAASSSNDPRMPAAASRVLGFVVRR